MDSISRVGGSASLPGHPSARRRHIPQPWERCRHGAGWPLGTLGLPGAPREASGVPARPQKTIKLTKKRPRGIPAPAAKFAVVAPLQTLYTRGRGPRDSIVCALSLHPRYRFRSGAGLHLHVVPARGYLGNSFISRKGYGLAYPLPFSYLTLLHESPQRGGLAKLIWISSHHTHMKFMY